MNFTKEDAKERLKESLAGFQHPTICDEVDFRFEERETETSNNAGKLVMGCQNCGVQDHFTYHEADE